MVPKNRIFWLGMHVVLTQTELPRLRSLGYEVFNPPYLADIIDQSANTNWTRSASTLPEDIQRKLEVTNFFYTDISDEISEILNEYFDFLIVTINPGWLNAIMSSYKGPVIFRTYGQPYSLSSELIKIGAIYKILNRENFWFVPHTLLTLDIEDDWLLERMKVIPYSLLPDLNIHKDSWRFDSEIRTIGLLCPRAADIPYYNANYMHLGHYFPGDNFKIFGGQHVKLEDPRIVGTLDRSEYFDRFSKLRGFVYHYTEPDVCYLPPVEFMTIGGPVVFQEGSLLSKYYDATGSNSPGRASNIESLVALTKKMESGDLGFIKEVVSSQSKVRELYSPDYVNPIFDMKFNDLLQGGHQIAPTKFLESIQVNSKSLMSQNSTVLLFHHFGPLIHKLGSNFHCSEGIARVTRLMVSAIVNTGREIIITSYMADLDRVRGFFQFKGVAKNKIKILVIDESNYRSKTTARNVGAVVNKKIPSFIKNSNFHKKILLRVFNKIERIIFNRKNFEYINFINDNKNITNIIVPHYYLFPDVLKIYNKNIFLYLPDYLPHFYKGNLAMGSSKTWEKIGKKICNKAKGIFTNSKYTAKYLPNTALKIESEKIFCTPLPFLNITGEDTEPNDSLVKNLPEIYIFYPTRDRPSKRLKDFIGTLESVNLALEKLEDKRRIYGILTTDLSEDVRKTFPVGASYLKIMSEVTDHDLAFIYKNALCLLFTSEMEGNFPTQISEALKYRTPIIATKMPLIEYELGPLSEYLQLIEIGDISEFSKMVIKILSINDSAVKNQEIVAKWVDSEYTFENFSKVFLKMLD